MRIGLRTEYIAVVFGLRNASVRLKRSNEKVGFAYAVIFDYLCAVMFENGRISAFFNAFLLGFGFDKSAPYAETDKDEANAA